MQGQSDLFISLSSIQERNINGQTSVIITTGPTLLMVLTDLSSSEPKFTSTQIYF